MRHLTGLLVALAVVTPALADTKSEIFSQNDGFNQAYAAHDFKKLSEFYMEDAVVYPQYSEVLSGRPAIRKLWESYEKDMSAVNYQTVEVVDAGDYAVQFGKYDATYQGKPDSGRYVTVWKKVDGGWRIIRDSWYSNGAP